VGLTGHFNTREQGDGSIMDPEPRVREITDERVGVWKCVVHVDGWGREGGEEVEGGMVHVRGGWR
jgi:hypothetical protein